MSSGLYSGVSGLALGVGLYRGVSGLWSGASGLITGWGGAVSPSLNLNLLAGPLDSRITFSRGSNATMIDGTGRIVYAPANLLTYSQEFDNAVWVKAQTTVTANATTAPDGTLTADKMLETAVTNVHAVYANFTYVAGTIYAASVYAKAAERSWIYLGADTSAAEAVFFDLSTGTVGNQGTGYVGSIQSVGDGWYRCTVIITQATALPPNYFVVGVAPANNTASYAGVATSGVFLWGAQLEPVTYQTTPGTYNPTTATAYYGPRFDAFPVTCLPRGLLLEGARTNLLTYSDQFSNAAWLKFGASVSADATISPDGTTNADKLVENSANAEHGTYQSIITSGTTVFSVFLKKGERSFAQIRKDTHFAVFDLQNGVVTQQSGGTGVIQNQGNGWYRCSIISTQAGDAVIKTSNVGTGLTASYAYLGDGTSGIFIWGAQVETGNFASSYIPTGASTATRNADSAIMTGNNFSSWYTLQSGTLVVGAEPEFSSTTGKPSALLLQSGTPNYHALYVDGPSGTLGYDVASSGVVMDFLASSYSYTPVPALQASLYSSVASQYAVYGQAVTYSNNFFANSANGGPATTDTSGAVPEGLTSMVLGQNDGEYGYGGWFGWLRGVQAYGSASSTTTLNQLSDAAGAAQQTLSLDFTGEMYYSGTVPFQTPPSFYVGFTVDAYVTED
jgi:hypothetical protein